MNSGLCNFSHGPAIAMAWDEDGACTDQRRACTQFLLRQPRRVRHIRRAAPLSIVEQADLKRSCRVQCSMEEQGE
jgi:hypothetical protein